ncbi:inositol monophosphatase 3 [Carcharodon carcharias]|uniref:inositol monophosphatase 3 n=1 Tax=Carcharodon carcharias TaxID=13397 RepID=UPI001B7E3CE9|nr:inositol monophosphatase 3 [Carcharodon carcharias]
MAPMGIRLSPLGVAVFALLAVGVLYHFYSGFLAGRIAIFRKLPGTDRVDLRELLALSVEAAMRGGEEVKRVMEGGELNGKSKGKTKEGADEMLTTGDLLSHQMMYYLIKNTFPTIQVFSEERNIGATPEIASWDHAIPKEILDKASTSEEVSSDSITVWIDPLDATQEYTEKLLHYVTTMVCVAVNGKPVIGVIHKPFADFTAWGMVHGGSNVSMRKSYNEKKPKIIISRSHTGTAKAFAQKAFGNDSDIKEAGGAGYKVLSLLNIPDDKQPDHADVYLHVTNIKKWDICAGNALLEALGGQMTTLEGRSIDYTDTELNEDGIVASIGVSHKMLLEKLPNLKSIKTQ